MKKTMMIDGALLAQAKLASGAATDTETVRLGLQALVRQAAYGRLRALRGSQPNATDTPRRRPDEAGLASYEGVPMLRVAESKATYGSSAPSSTPQAEKE